MHVQLVCILGCEATCDKRSPECLFQCEPPRCQCVQGFYRNINDECVTAEECPNNILENITK